MADIFDIFNPPKTKVIKGVEGKMMLVHSNSVKCGKTTVGSQMPKPFYLRFEQGANFIDGMPFAPLKSWSDFKKVAKKLTSDKKTKVVIDGVEKEVTARELYETLIPDTFDVAIRWCRDFVCSKYGVDKLGDGNGGYGLWQEFADEWFRVWNPLMNAGYFIYGISHSEIRKVKDGRTGEEVEKYAPKGDKRTIDPIIEMVDFIGYVKANGVDEEGNVIPSSIYFAETDEYLAGSRLDTMPTEIKVFSAENIQNAIKKAIEDKEKQNKSVAITYEEKQEAESKKEWTHKEILEAIKPCMEQLWVKYPDDVNDIITENLGEGIKVSETTKKQIPQLEMVLFDLKNLAEDKGVKIG